MAIRCRASEPSAAATKTPFAVLKASCLPSGDQASERTPRTVAGSRRRRPAPFGALPQTVPSSRPTKAIVAPSGDQAGATPSTATSARAPVATFTTDTPPAVSLATAIALPFGDQLGLPSLCVAAADRGERAARRPAR